MIPVQKQPEPDDFDLKVRQKGRKWLADNGLTNHGPVPKGTRLEPYWRECLTQMHKSYQRICAYSCMFIPPVTGALSIDHLVPKSQAIEHAYEWSNYRLVCSKMNSRKHVFADVLDPFDISDGTFRLELFSGRIYPNPELLGPEFKAATDTIHRLGLDDADLRAWRIECLDYFREGEISLVHLKKSCPFVYLELIRQEGASPARKSQ
jgi:hypothetical protein